MILLDLEKKKLNQWRSVHDQVVNSINFNKKKFKNRQELLNTFFTAETTQFPQHDKFFKYKIGQSLRVDLTPGQRKKLNFKYSLEPGSYPDDARRRIRLFSLISLSLSGKLSSQLVTIKARTILTRGSIFFPYYTIQLKNKVWKKIYIVTKKNVKKIFSRFSSSSTCRRRRRCCCLSEKNQHLKIPI